MKCTVPTNTEKVLQKGGSPTERAAPARASDCNGNELPNLRGWTSRIKQRFQLLLGPISHCPYCKITVVQGPGCASWHAGGNGPRQVRPNARTEKSSRFILRQAILEPPTSMLQAVIFLNLAHQVAANDSDVSILGGQLSIKTQAVCSCSLPTKTAPDPPKSILPQTKETLSNRPKSKILSPMSSGSITPNAHQVNMVAHRFINRLCAQRNLQFQWLAEKHELALPLGAEHVQEKFRSFLEKGPSPDAQLQRAALKGLSHTGNRANPCVDQELPQ